MEINNQKNDQNIIPNDADKPQKGVNVPNLRFNHFDYKWNKVQLKNIVNVYDGTHQTPRYTKHGVQFVSVEDIKTLDKATKYISEEDFKNEFKISPKYGDILMTRIGDIGTPAIVYNNNELAYYVSLALLKPKKVLSSFLKFAIEANAFQKELWKRSIHVAFPKKINKEEIGECKLSIPSNEEQKQVAELLLKIDERILTQSKIIEKYESLISTIRTNIFSSFQCKWIKICDLVENKSLQLNRGNIIPKHPKDDVYKYPVYSSSVQKDGLMGYSDYYMFDKELITWSIDGGGDIFFREKHKFCVTNVCGILQLDTNKFSYRFVAEALKYQHSKMTFDYQTKAHPSVIEKLYALPDIELNEQNKYSKLFEVLYSKLGNERKYLEIIKEQKKYLLSNMFI